MNIDIPENTPIDEEFIKDAEAKLSQVGQDLTKNKMEEAKLLQASMADGGPSSINEALNNLIRYCKLTPRSLALRAGMSRKRIVRMINGEIGISLEDNEKMERVFRSIAPNLYKF